MLKHPLFSLVGQRALVTGCGSADGIGFATARLLGQLGAELHITATGAHIQDRVSALRAEGLEVSGYAIDLTDRAATFALAAQLTAPGPIGLLVNNAGMVQQGAGDSGAPFAQLDPADWDQSLARNLGTTFNMTRALVPTMVAAGYGRIVNVSSVTGPLVSNPGESAYSAAKAAQVGMSHSLALELAAHGICINNVAPGWIHTASQSSEERLAGSYSPPGRSGRPAEVAFAIACLLAPGASYINGATLVVDGGNCLQEAKGH